MRPLTSHRLTMPDLKSTAASPTPRVQALLLVIYNPCFRQTTRPQVRAAGVCLPSFAVAGRALVVAVWRGDFASPAVAPRGGVHRVRLRFLRCSLLRRCRHRAGPDVQRRGFIAALVVECDALVLQHPALQPDPPAEHAEVSVVSHHAVSRHLLAGERVVRHRAWGQHASHGGGACRS